MAIIISGAKMTGPSNGNSIKDPGENIRRDLERLKFMPKRVSIWKNQTLNTLKRLIALSQFELNNNSKYLQYLDFFGRLHNSCGLKSKVYILILPSARDLMEMDVEVLIENIPAIKQSFVFGNICNLTNLPTFYSRVNPEPVHNEAK